MKIVYIHQYFKTPEQGGAIRSFHVAKAMVEAGHTVTVITSHNSNSYNVITNNGVIVHYLPVQYDNSFSVFKRMVSFFRFMIKALILSFRIKKELLYITSTPLSVGFIGLMNKFFLNIPYIFEVRDLWPEVPIKMRFIENKLLIKCLYAFEILIYKNAKSIIALSPGIKEEIEEKVNSTPVYLVPNFSDFDSFSLKPTIPNNKIVISYTGTIGFANGLDAFLKLALVAQNSFQDKFEFFIMGEGSEKKKLESLVIAYGLTNLTFIAHSNKENVRDQIQKSDLIYISFAAFSILGKTTSPNKYFDALAMGKIVILNFRGWLLDLTLSNDFGYYHDVNINENELLNLIIQKKLDNTCWTQMKVASLEASKSNFDKNSLLKKLVSII